MSSDIQLSELSVKILLSTCKFSLTSFLHISLTLTGRFLSKVRYPDNRPIQILKFSLKIIDLGMRHWRINPTDSFVFPQSLEMRYKAEF